MGEKEWEDFFRREREGRNRKENAELFCRKNITLFTLSIEAV